VPAQIFADPSAHPSGAMFGWAGRLYACDRASQLESDAGVADPAGKATISRHKALCDPRL